MTLLHLDLRCDRCGTRPNLRFTQAEIERHADAPDDEIVGTWECQKKKCRKAHLVTAGAFKRAS